MNGAKVNGRGQWFPNDLSREDSKKCVRAKEELQAQREKENNKTGGNLPHEKWKKEIFRKPSAHETG